MDGEPAIRSACETVFPAAPTLLCTWHVNKCVKVHCQSDIGFDEWPAFDQAWRNVIQSPTKEEFERR
jgi:hypothetical protein